MSNCLDRANVELEQLERDLENGTINEGEYLESCNALKASVDAAPPRRTPQDIEWLRTRLTANLTPQLSAQGHPLEAQRATISAALDIYLRMGWPAPPQWVG